MRSSHSQTAPVSRRRFLKQSALAAGALAVPAAPFAARAATALKPVTFTLDWLYQGASAGFLVAQEKGFYRDAGLDVTILAGKGSGTTAQLVASKATPIGFSDGFVVANSVAKGMAIKTVGTIYRRDPAAIMVLDELPIKSPKDLEGKSVAMTAGSAQFQQWPAYRQRRRHRPEQDQDRQHRSGRRWRRAGQRQGRRHRRLRVQLRAEHRGARQEKAAHILVCGFRRDRSSPTASSCIRTCSRAIPISFARSSRLRSKASCMGGSTLMKRSRR